MLAQTTHPTLTCHPHNSPATHFCLNPSCITALCSTCLLSHKNQHPNHKDQYPISKTLEKCRSKLSQDTRNLQACFTNFENQLEALEALQEARNRLDKSMAVVIEQVRQFYSQVKAEMDLRNRELEQVVGNQAVIREAMQVKRRVNELRFGLNTEREVREALEFSCEGVYERLRGRELKHLKEYVITSPTYSPSIQISKPQFLSKPLTAGTPCYHPKPIPTLSNQHFIITQPSTSQSDSLFFFDTIDNHLKIFHIKQSKWYTKTPPRDFPRFPQFGEAIYDAIQKKYYYLGGAVSDRVKSKMVFCYSGEEEKWEGVGEMRRERSSFATAMLKGDNKSGIVIVGGLDSENRTMKDCEIYSPGRPGESRQICSLNFAASNSCLCAFNENMVLKVGGLASNSATGRMQISETFQKYNKQNNQWILLNTQLFLSGSINPQDMHKFFYANSCAVKINDSQIFIFGGHGSDKKGTTQSYIFKIQPPVNTTTTTTTTKPKYSIRFSNLKPLPTGQAFSKTKPTIYNKSIYVLQDIEYNFSKVVSNEKSVLRFDGYEWTVMERRFQ